MMVQPASFFQIQDGDALNTFKIGKEKCFSDSLRFQLVMELSQGASVYRIISKHWLLLSEALAV